MEANGLEIRSKATKLAPQENIEKEVIGKIRCAYDELVDISKLIPNPKNPNKHTDDQIKRLAEIIDYTGMRRPIAVSNRSGFMTCGHGRLLALKVLGWTKAPVNFQDYDDEAQEYADMTADNAIAEWAELDLGKINLDIQEVGPFDINMLGLKDFVVEPMEKFEPQADEDEVPEVKGEPVTRRGDIWLLGEHRVMCGDSTMIDDAEKLMNGEKADMVFTDPPYNIDYQDMGREFDKIKNDKMSDGDFLQFLEDSIYWDSETMYICCSWQYAHIFRQAMENKGRKPKAMIVWNKVNPAQNLDKYYKAHEIIWYTGEFGGQKTLRSDVWELKRQKNTLHPTMKPIEIMEMALEDQPNCKLVNDSFLGSGSTLIACEKTNRKCYGMELDEHYCDVIIERWQKYTGKEATLESSGEKFNELKNDSED